MKSSIYRFSAVLAMVASMAFSAAPALAGGGYDWTDISDKIAERTNRPVWAMAYAAPYWYLTDGQELWNGGHVWRTEGSAMADITTDVRNAGISRVDDIVSDGQTVMFLQDVVRMDNQFRAVVNRDGSYSDLTSFLRGALQYNEGLSQISGRNGTWHVVTTKARLFRLNTIDRTISEIFLPSEFRSNLDKDSQNGNYYGNTLLYSTAQGKPSGKSAVLGSLPVGANQWIVFGKTGNYNSSHGLYEGYVMYRYDGSNFTKVKESSPSTYNGIRAAATNGVKALFILSWSSLPYVQKTNGLEYDGVSFREINDFQNPCTPDYRCSDPKIQTLNGDSTLLHDGSRWMLVSGKHAYQIDPGSNTVTDIGENRDFFITGAGNNNGSIILGGAVSELGRSEPTYPLTLKLVKLTSGSATNGTSYPSGTFGGGKTYSSYSGPNLTTSGNPSDYQVGNGETFVYRAVASDTNGIDRIELYANSARVQTCYSDTCEYSNVYYTNGLSTRAIPLAAKAYDRYGNVTESSSENLTVDQYGTSNGNTSGNGIWLTTTVDLSNNSLYRGSSTTYRVQASASQGLNRIEAYVNGSLKRTCDFSRSYGNQTCDLTVYGSDYTSGQSVNLSARATDYNGQTAWSDTKYLTITDNSSNTGNGQISGQTGNTYFWTWTEPNNATYLKRGETLTFNVGASDADGLRSIVIYVNGNQKRTCDYSRAYGNQTCSLTIYGSDYSVNSQLAVNAKITDYNNAEAWPTMQYLTVQDSSYNGGSTSGDVSAWGWFEPSTSYLNRGSSTTFKVQANATQGLQRIEVYADGSLKRTCDFSRAYSTQSCDLNIYGNDYSIAQHSFNAKATDYYGKTTWSDSKTLTVQDNGGSGTYGNTVYSLSPSDRDLKTNENFTFTANASDSDGLNRIEVYVNDNNVQTCNYSYAYGNRECTYQIYGSNYPVGSNLNVYAKVTDSSYNTIQTNSRNYRIVGSGSTNGGTGDYPATWSWSDPEKSQVTTSESAVYHVGAWDNDGLNRIEIYVNGILAHNCNFGTYTAYGNQTCQFTLNGGNYKNGDQVYVNAKAVDAQGRESWASSRTYNVTGGSGSSGSNQSSWIWSDPNESQIYGSQNVTFYVGAWAQNGIRKIEIIGNGNVMKICDFGYSAYGNQQCGATVYTTGSYYGRITDGYGNTFSSESKSFTVVNASTPTTNDVGGTVSMTSDHDGGYGASDTIQFSANGQDADGIDRLELMVNGRLVKTCSTGSCSYSGGPYADRLSVTYGARLVDLKGRAYFTGYKTIYKK